MAMSSEAGDLTFESQNDYKRPLSNAEVVPKFRIEASMEEALCDAVLILFDGTEQIQLQERTKYDNFIIDARDICTEPELVNFVDTISQHSSQVYGVRMPGCRLSETRMHSVVAHLTDHGRYQYLVDLDLSYTSLSRASVELIANLLDPAISGYCPIKRLQLSHCKLREFGLSSIFEAARSNVFLNEMHFYGNHCSDLACVAISRCLENPENRFLALTLGDNNISASGIRTLCPSLSRHTCIRHLTLNSNHIGDDGASALVRALKRCPSIEELNLSNCGLNKCKWAKHLKHIKNLSTLNLACNSIDDFGCLSICNGLLTCAAVRHLNISNNKFGGPACSGLGTLIESNRGLISINMSYTYLIVDVWTAVSVGLSSNRTLFNLDLRWSNISVNVASLLSEALEINDVCTIDYGFNPVPAALLTDCRAICPEIENCKRHLGLRAEVAPVSPTTRSPSKSKAAVGNAANLIRPTPCREGNQLRALDIAEAWRSEMREKLTIELALQEFDASGHRVEVPDEEEEDGLDKAMKDETIRICYGNESEEIGVIAVHGSTTYAQAQELIRPLIKAYMASVDPESMHDLLYKFTFLLRKGEIVQGSQLKSRCILADAVLNHHTTVVRPGNWISLPE